jgi:hypothetical protein
VATLDVGWRNGHYEGTIGLDGMSPELRRLFERFEEIVEGQMFGLLDDIEARIATVPLRAAFEDGVEVEIADLQVFPSTGGVSFISRQAVGSVVPDPSSDREMPCETTSTGSPVPGRGGWPSPPGRAATTG